MEGGCKRIQWFLWLVLATLTGTAAAQNSIEDSLQAQGELLTQKGHYQQAIQTFEALLAWQRKLHPKDSLPLTVTYTLLGRVSFRQQNLKQAKTYFNKALQIQQIKYGELSAQNTHLYINLSSTCQKLQQHTEALIYAQKALASHPSGNYYLHTTVGMCYYGIHKYDSALYHYKRAAKFKQSSGIFQNIGDTYLKLRQPTQALSYYHQATHDSLPFYTTIGLHYRKAQAWHAHGQPDKATPFLVQADSMLKARQQTLYAEKDKLVLGQWVQAITELGITISYQLCQLYQQTSALANPAKYQHWREQAFYFSERQKAGILLDNLTKETQAKENQTEKPQTSIIRLQQIQQQLNDSTAIIEYGFGKDSLYAFVITKEQIILKALPKDSINKHWKSYNLYIHVLLVKECVNYMYQFYKWLIAPLYATISSKSQWLIIGGVLNVLPFDTFCKYKGADTQKTAFLDINYQKFPYLIYTHTISYGTSATLAFLTPASRSHTWQFVGVAPGNYQDTTTYPTLKHAQTEVTNIATILPGQKHLLLGKAATLQQILKQAAQARWLHFATHGISSHEEDLNGILLYNSQWLVKDIQHLKLQCDLVVMSSCSAAAGRFAEGEGLIAMTRSFIKAGVHNIVYTLWSVNDKLATRLMTSFYKHLTQGMSYAHALRQAKLEFLRDKEPVYGYPGLWAVFMLEGKAPAK